MPLAAATSLRRGEAGRAGADVRSDLHVVFEERVGGGIEVELRSRVEPYYGENIRAQVSAALSTLDVTDALVSIVDEGALQFVIDARMEAAVRRAGLAPKAEVLPQALPPGNQTQLCDREISELPCGCRGC